MRIVLLGAPGSGKGTQAKLLAKRYRVPQISSGDLLREAVAAGTASGKKARKKMEAGELVPDSLVLEFIRERLSRKDARRGVILDGFPRNIPQAQELDGLLGMRGQPVQIALLIEVDERSLLKRIPGRRNCMKCGAIHNIDFIPPAKEGVCGACRGKLAVRSDDNEETARNRLRVYREQAAPLMTYYRAQHKLRTVRASGEIPAIHEKISDIIDLEIRPLEIKTLETAAESHDEETGTIIAGGKVTKMTAAKPKPKRRAGKKAEVKKSAAAPKAKPTKPRTVKKPAAKKPAARKTTPAAKSADKGVASKKTTAKKTAAQKATPAKKQPPIKKDATSKKPVVAKQAAVEKKTAQKKPAAKSTPAAAKDKPAKKEAAQQKPAAPKKSAEKKKKKTAPKKKAPKKAQKKASKPKTGGKKK